MTAARFGCAVLACLAAGAPGAIAQAPQPGAADEAPFVEHRLALQISDASPVKQSLIISNVANVLKVFGPDKVAIEVVAYGPGIYLLHADNPNAARIASLVQQGVKFDACMNTIDTIERETGKPFPLNPLARKVEAGIVQIMTLAERGYTTIRP